MMKTKIVQKSLALILSLSLILSGLCAIVPSASAAGWVIQRQCDSQWYGVYVGDAHVYDTACGIFSIVNAVGYLTGLDMGVMNVANWAHSIGGYNSGGTDITVVHPRLEARFGAEYGFTVPNTGTWYTGISNEVKTHLMGGGAALLNVYGHLIAAVGYDPDTDYVHVLDSYPSRARGTLTTGDTWIPTYRFSQGTWSPEYRMNSRWYCLLSADKRFTVTFDSKGGTAYPAQTVRDGALATHPGTPYKTGYTFGGWVDEYGNAFNFGATVIHQNRTLSAVWKPYEVGTNFDPNPAVSEVDPYPNQTSYVWPYFHAGGVELFKGGDELGWPSMTSAYWSSIDINKTPILHFQFNERPDNTPAQFNAVIFYCDQNGTMNSVELSKVAGLATTDFAAGTPDIQVDLGAYLVKNGNIAANGIVPIPMIRFYVIGGLDSLVSIKTINAIPNYTFENKRFTSDVYPIDYQSGLILDIGSKTTVSGLIRGIRTEYAMRIRQNGRQITGTDYVGTGAVVEVICDECGGTVERSFELSVLGDIDGDGIISSNDIRGALAASNDPDAFSRAQFLAGDYNKDGILNTIDARLLLAQTF